MLKFPYGISDFYQVITEGYFYLDRTDRIAVVENLGKHLLFLRPRRFGKSLWLSTLENYYDAAKAAEFDTLFGHLAVGRAPTPLHNRYLVIKWNFSLVDPQGNVDEIRRSLHDHINGCIEQFTAYYQDLLDYEIRRDEDNALRSFQSLLAAVRHSPYRLYLLIDEYDNFANAVLMSGRSDSRARYEALLYGEGALKVVFKAVKAATEGAGLDRVFITGVSPVVLSDVTSGYNIAKHISLEPALHDLCGFQEGEVAGALAQVAVECGFPPEKAEEALATVRTFYNGYAFCHDSRELAYNPTLALYYLDHFQQHCQAPPNMLDSNFAMDRQKLAYVARLPGGQAVILNALQENPPLAIFQLSDRFGLAEMLKTAHDTSFMVSLLYYLGVLTLDGRTAFGEIRLRIPNLVVRKLYAEQLRELLLPDGQVLDTIREAARRLYQAGDLQAVCDFVEQRYFPVLSNRDYRWASEMTLKTAFLTLLFNDEFYIVDSEAALERGYADLVLIVRPEMRRYRLLDILIEFKYVRLQDAGLRGEQAQKMDREAIRALPVVQQKFREAAAQLQRYRRRLADRYGEEDRLRVYAVVALGFERLVWLEVHAASSQE